MERPLVTVLVPARNEAADLPRCLEGVLAQDLDHSLMEVLVVDGGSTDDTAVIASSILEDSAVARAEVLREPAGVTPAVLNAGLAAATGKFLVRVDARSLIPRHYVRRCVELLQEDSDRSVVGGAQVATARDDSPRAIGIARALNNRWGMGLARYRRGAPSGPTDTVYLGAFRTDELRAAGGWDERFPTNQDFELNRRMGRHGVVWLESSLEVGYLPRRTVSELFRQYRRFGEWKVRYWKLTGDRPRPRQVLLLSLPILVGLAAGVVGRARPARWSALLVASLAGAAAIEGLGSDRPPGSASARARSAAAMAAIGSGWTWGVWSSLVRSARR